MTESLRIALTFDGRKHIGIDATKNIARLLAHETVLREEILKRIKPH